MALRRSPRCIIQAHIIHLLWKTPECLYTQGEYTLTHYSFRPLKLGGFSAGGVRRGVQALFMMAAVCGRTGETGHVRHVSTPQRGAGSRSVTVSALCFLVNHMLWLCSFSRVFPLRANVSKSSVWPCNDT